MNTTQRERYVVWMALSALTGALIDCALPIVHVMLGFGAAVPSCPKLSRFLSH
jgi:hypothetical protein